MSKFVYMLNAMEAAAQSDRPAIEGYGAKRQAVLEYVHRAENLLLKAHFFMNAQAYEQEDCEDFCRKLADFLGKPS